MQPLRPQAPLGPGRRFRRVRPVPEQDRIRLNESDPILLCFNNVEADSRLKPNRLETIGLQRIGSYSTDGVPVPQILSRTAW